MSELKRLQIVVNGVEFINADYAEVSVCDGPGGVRVEGKLDPDSGRRTATGLLEMLTSASKSRTEAIRLEKSENAVDGPVTA